MESGDFNFKFKDLDKKNSAGGQLTSQPSAFTNGKTTDSLQDYWKRPFSKRTNNNNSKKKILKISGIVLGAVIILVGFIWVFFGRSFDRDKIIVSIESPERVIAGEEVNFLVKYSNNGNVDLLDAKIKLMFPVGSLTENGSELAVEKSVGLIKASGAGEINFTARLMGQEDEIKPVSAFLTYEPKNIKSRFENKASAESSIVAVPIILNFDLPEKIVSGQVVEGALQYTNTSALSFSNLILKIEFPESFQLQSAHPEPSDADGAWEVFELASREEGKILFSGIIEGQSNEDKPFQAKIGFNEEDSFVVLAEGVNSTLVSDSPLVVFQSLNSQNNYLAHSGEKLDYAIRYKNTAEVGIPSVSIVVKLNSRALDYSTMKVDNNGSFDSSLNEITWKAGDISKLALINPGEEGEVGFSVRVLKEMPVSNFSDKNFTIQTNATIDTPKVPLSLSGTEVKGTSEMTVKVKTDVDLLTKGYYHDDVIPNSGPMPPKVGQTTTFTLYWSIINTSNDLSNAMVEAVLPNNVHWQNKTSLDNGTLKFDSSTNKLVWTPGEVLAGAGNIAPVRVISWQVAVTPSVNQVGQNIELVRDPTFTAVDNFTGENITVNGTNLNTGGLTDLAGGGSGIVVE